MSDYLVGIDVGTTGSKAMVMDTEGNVISSGYREYGCFYPKPNWVEQDAELLIQQTFGACKDAIESGNIDSSKVIAVGFSVQRATFLLVDNNNKVIGDNFYGWQDNRAESEIDYITSKIPADELYKTTGMPVTPTFTLEKLVWLQRNKTEEYKQVKKILLVSDYVMWRFGTEDFFCERGNACVSGLLDVQTLEWADKILQTFEIEEDKLATLVDPGTVIGAVSKEAAALSGLKEGTQLVTGTGDQQCAAVGAGVAEADMASLTLGTAGLLVVGTDEPMLEDKSGFMMVPASGIKGMYEVEGIQLGAASSYRWTRDVIANIEKVEAEKSELDPYVEMEKHMSKSVPGSNGMIFMPFLIGSGYPYWNPEAKGAFLGIKFSNTRSDMIRCVMEGITLESRDMYEKMKESGLKIKSLAMTGGATKSPAWRQMIADIFNIEVKRLKVEDATIVGAAILAGVGAGIFSDAKDGVSKMVKFEDVVKPDPEAAAAYDKVYEVYKETYEALNTCGIYSKLSALCE